MQMMEYPHDLDPYAPDQIDLTRKIDSESGMNASFATMQLANLTTIKIAALCRVPLSHWQRGAYEANAMRDGSLHIELMAGALWAFVKWLQEERKLAMRAAEDPSFLEFMKKITGREDFDLEDLGLGEE